MTDPGQQSPEEKKQNTNKIKQRLILLGIFLALVSAYEIGELIMHIAHPSM